MPRFIIERAYTVDEAAVREHAERLGDHSVVRIYEIAGDVTPDDFPLD